VKRVILTGGYRPTAGSDAPVHQAETLAARLEAGQLDAEGLIAAYCSLLYRRLGTYEEVARRTRLDRRTVKKYLQVVQDQAE